MALKPAYRRFLYVIIGIAVFLVVLPELIRFGARYALTEYAAQRAEIEDIDLNLFTGRVGVTGLEIEYNDQTTLALGALLVDIDMAALFSKHLLVERAELADVNALVYEQAGQWVAVLPLPKPAEGQEEPEEKHAAEENPWKVGVNTLALDNVALAARYQEQTFRLQLDQVTAADLFMWEPDKRASLVLRGALNDAPLNFDSGLKPFAEPRNFALDISLQGLDLEPVNPFLPETVERVAASLNLDTRVGLEIKTDGSISLSQDGTVALTLDAVQASGGEVSARDVRWQGKVAVTLPPQAPTRVDVQGKASVSGLQAAYEPLAADARWEALSWSGDLNLQLPKEAPPVVTGHGNLTLDELQASQETLQLAQHLKSFQWQGNLTADMADLHNGLALEGSVDLKEWQLEDQAVQVRVLSFADLSLRELKLQGLDQITLAETDLNSLAVLKNTGAETAMVNLGDVVIQDAVLKEQHQLQLAAVRVADLKGAITRTAEGKLRVLDDWLADIQHRVTEFENLVAAQQPAATDPAQGNAPASAAEEDAPDAPEKKPPFTYALEEITFAGDNQLTFEDLAVTPAVVHPVNIKTLNIGKLDSTSLASMTPLKVELALYDHGNLQVSGQATPLQSLDALQADIKAELKGVELPELSPYLASAVGYRAKSGQLNLDSDAEIKNGKLDSKTRVKILRLNLKPVDQALIDKMSKKLTMPVETALSVITDSDNTLALTVPVTGDLTSPDIQLDRIVAGAMAQAVQNAAFTYFKYAVQPFGAIMLVSEKIGDMTMQAKFEPARFVPGTADIVPEQHGYLEKVAGMIKEKEDFSILVCVMVTNQDFQARENPPTLQEGESYQWDEASESLAKSRLNTIKNSLINDHGLSPDKVQSCSPQLGTGEPRAIMGI